MADSDMVRPERFSRRSPIYRTLLQSGAEFMELGGVAVVGSFGDPEGEAEQARHLGLCDLSTSPRTGFKGVGTVEWLREQGVEVPDNSNRARRQPQGEWAARLAPNEVLILGDLGHAGRLGDELDLAWANSPNPPAQPRGFHVPRRDSHGWFVLTGKRVPDMFAKICAVDLRPQHFANGGVAQTSVARINSILIRCDLGSVPTFYALSDTASSEYFWDCLLDAAAEFDGKPVGLLAVRTLK